MAYELSVDNLDAKVTFTGSADESSPGIRLAPGKDHVINFECSGAFEVVLQRVGRDDVPRDLYDASGALATFDDATAQRKDYMVPGGIYCFKRVTGSDPVTMYAEEA